MKKLNKLLNEISKHPISFKNMEMQLNGVHLSEDMIVDSDETMILIDYKFNKFIMRENVWEVDVDLKNQQGEILECKSNNQEILQERIYEI